MNTHVDRGHGNKPYILARLERDHPDILARRKEAQKMTAFRLSLLGWTQEEIGEVIGTSQPNVVNFLSEFSDLKKVIKNLLSEGHPYLRRLTNY